MKLSIDLLNKIRASIVTTPVAKLGAIRLALSCEGNCSGGCSKGCGSNGMAN